MPITWCYSNTYIDIFFILGFVLPQNRDNLYGLAVSAWYTGPAEIHPLRRCSLHVCGLNQVGEKPKTNYYSFFQL